MKLSSKIYFFVFLTITLTLSLLTVLMHFKYHVTRSELINTRFSILAHDMKWVIERGVKLGIELTELKNVQQIIETGIKQDKDISSVTVFRFDQNAVDPLYQTTPSVLDANLSRHIMESIFSTKRDYWSFEVEGTGYIGINFKDALGVVLGGLYMTYSVDLIDKEEIKEVQALYLRLLAAIIMIALISYFISYKTIKPLDDNLSKMNNIMKDYLESPNSRQVHDLSLIRHPDLRKIFSKTLSASKHTLKSFEQVNKIIHEVEKS